MQIETVRGRLSTVFKVLFGTPQACLMGCLLAYINAAPLPHGSGWPASVVAGTSASQQPLPGALSGITAFENVSVVPMDTDRVLTGQTVLVEGGKITAMGPASQVQVPAGAIRIDGQGRYLIPGLSDMHAHVALGTTGEFHLDTLQGTASAEYRLLLWLANGATTVRLLDYFPTGGWGELEMRLRARQAAGDLASPRIYSSGGWGPEAYTASGQGDETQLRLDSIANYVAAYKAAGYDLIKVHNESGVVVDSVLAAAHRVGIPVVGHIPADMTIEHAIQAGYKSIEHTLDEWKSDSVDWSQTDTAKIRALGLAMRKAGVWYCPTQAHYEGAILNHDHNVAEKTPQRHTIIKIFYDVGAGLLLGTDNPAGVGLHLELQAFVAAGLTPYQALVVGTRNAAVYFGTLNESGTIAVGKRADLVLLTANPLADIHNTTAIDGVMTAGRWFPIDTLKKRIQQDPKIGE